MSLMHISKKEKKGGNYFQWHMHRSGTVWVLQLGYDKEPRRENALTEHFNQVSAKEEIHVMTKDRRIIEFKQQTLAITEVGGPQINFLNFERLKQQPMRAENATDYL